jgi:hypothetical protein
MDETWFLTIIYCAARQLATTNSSVLQYSRDATLLMDKVLERLRRSVESTSKGELPSDEIICAIACLTTLEVSTLASQSYGMKVYLLNHPQSGLENALVSKTHASGLAGLVRARGGIDNINEDVRFKVYR